MRCRLLLGVVLALCAGSATARAQAAPAPKPAPVRPPAAVDSGSSAAAIAGGLMLEGIGAFGGAVALGSLARCPQLTEDPCDAAINAAMLGAALGGAFGVATGVHLGNRRQGSWKRDLTAAGLVWGAGFLVASTRNNTAAVGALLVTPVVALIITAGVERTAGLRKASRLSLIVAPPVRGSAAVGARFAF